MNEEYLLEGVFQHLVHLGFPLGIRDFRDALEALRGGYGSGSREELLWLCHALWARTNEESRQLDQLFRQFPFPSPEVLQQLAGQEVIAPPESPSVQPAPVSPIPATPKRSPAEDKRAVPSAAFVSGSQPEGIGLPRAQVEPDYREIFILTPRPIISMRALTIIWRRFRSARREGPKTELDLDETIREQCRTGILEQPVLAPARRNQARLIVLIDVSDSMSPWRDFEQEVVESLRASQLGHAHVYYFHNSPSENFYERETLTKPVKIQKVLKQHDSSTMLIVSDAGAARGSYRSDRVSETAEFLARVWRQWQPIVWMNPMPAKRWANTSAGAIAKLRHTSMLPLTEEGLVRAIDMLRGKTVKT